jgi:hypothetical protein
MKHQRVILEGDFWVASLLSSGTASLLRIASAARSGSHGGPGRWCRERVGAAKDSNPFVDLLFEFVFVDEAVDLDGAEEVGSLQISACTERGRTKRIPCEVLSSRLRRLSVAH